MLRSLLTTLFCLAFCEPILADESTKDANRLAYLDECNPWYPHKDFPKLITPQWVGEEGVEAVIVLAIDDMRDPAKYEAYLRPILNRLKQIDGRAPVSIMTCDVKPDDAQLQSWLGEGLSIECHTIDHPCPILQGGEGLKKVSGTLEASPLPKEGETPESSRHLFEPAFAKAKSTYDRCVDLMGTIPGNKPVAFRTPCCDSLNTVSPRFFSEIFSSTTEKGNFLQIDSSVFTFFTSEDESLPKELVLDANGKERFWKYLPKNNKYGGNTHDNFVNYIKNYPYPYVINNSCWEIPCIAPSDWSAQHLHGINNPVTVEDWKAAIDLTVHKQGCFSLVFHPHGWIKPEQVVEMIDHAVAKHGNKVKFLNFREVADRLRNSLATDADQYRWNEVRVVDVDNDGFMDIIDGGIGVAAYSSIPEKHLRAGSMNLWKSNGWRTCKFPVNLMDLFNHVPGVKQRPVQFFPVGTELTLAVFDPDPVNPQWDNIDNERQPTVWAFEKNEWRAEQIGPHGGLSELKIDWGQDGALWRDFDGDGRTDLLLFHNQLNAEWDEERGDYLGEDVAEVWSFNVTKSLWESREWVVPISPSRHSLRSLRFVDINQDARLDLLIADATASEIWLQSTDQKGWTEALPTSIGERLRSITKTTTRNVNIGSVTYEANNGFFIHDNHFCWINEDTAKLPDLMYRVSFDEVLKASGRASALRGNAPAAPPKQDGDSAAEQRQPIAPGVSPGNEIPNDEKAPEGRQNSDGHDQSAAPSGLEHSSSTETPGSRPGLSAAVAPRLNRNRQEERDQHGGLTPNRSPEYAPVPIGAAVVDITPDYPVRLTGYGNRMKESEGVAAKIHARALVIASSASGDLAAEQRQPIAPGVSPGKEAPNDEKAPEGRHNEASNKLPAAPSGLDGSSLTETPGSRPGLQTVVAPRLNRSGPESPPTASTPSSGLPATFSPDLGGEGTLDKQPLAILITVDNCGVPLEMTEAVYERIAAKYNIPRQNFAISSTHSHSAPWLRGFAPNIFAEVPEDHAAHLAQYEKELTDKLVDVVEKAIASQRPGHLSYGFGEAGFAMNRRALANGKWSGFGEVPDGPTDKRVPVLAAHDVDGKLIAVLANYACHCTTETGDFNQISGDWAGFAADMLEADHPGAVALIAIGCGADANPSPRGTHEQAKVHGRTLADEVTRILASGPREGEAPAEPRSELHVPPVPPANPARQEPRPPDVLMHRINPDILCNMARIDLPLGPIPTRETWEQQAKEPGVIGSRARYFLQMLDEGKPIPTTIPNYPVQTWCFGDDLAMVFLGGEVVVDYSIRMNDMFDSDRLWINAYSNDVPCYIASARVLREGGYECDSSMLYYRRPTRLAPEAEDVLCDSVQKIMPHKFYSEKLQQDFPAPKSPEESLKTLTTKPDLRIVLAASEPLIRDPVAFDWDERGRLWVVEMGDYPNGDSSASGGRQPSGTAIGPPNSNADFASGIHTRGLTPSARHAFGRVQMLEDTDKNGVYDKATTFLDNLAFPTGIHCWRGGVIITMAPEIFYAEDTDGDGKADVRETMYRGFVEGNQQHRVNGLRWGLDGWLYLANGDSGGEIAGTGFVPGNSASGRASALRVDAPDAAQAGQEKNTHGGLTPNRSRVSLRGRDLRINPDTNELDALSGQTQFGRERDDFGNWFGNNNSNPIWQYVLEDRYVRQNPHAGISQVTAPVAVVPGAAPVYPTSRTLARFNDFAFANRFTSACSTMIYRDNYLGEQYYGNAFTSEPVHNLVSRLVLTRDGYGFKGERAPDEQQLEFLASSDNWFRPTMIRTGPDGAIWVADMYRAVIEHPEWIPPEYQRKMNLYAGSDRGRIYRIVPASECCGETQGDLAAEQRQPIAPGVSPGNDVPKDDKAPEGRQNFEQPWNEIPIEALIKRLESPNGWWRDTAQRILTQRSTELTKIDVAHMTLLSSNESKSPAIRAQVASLLTTLFTMSDLEMAKWGKRMQALAILMDDDPQVRRTGILMLERLLADEDNPDLKEFVEVKSATDPDLGVRLQMILTLGQLEGEQSARMLAQMMFENFSDETLRNAALSSLRPDHMSYVLEEFAKPRPEPIDERLPGLLLAQAAAMKQTTAVLKPLAAYLRSVDVTGKVERVTAVTRLLQTLQTSGMKEDIQSDEIIDALGDLEMAAANAAVSQEQSIETRVAAIQLIATILPIRSGDYITPMDLVDPDDPSPIQAAGIELAASPFFDAQGENQYAYEVLGGWDYYLPSVRESAVNKYLQRELTTEILLDAVESGIVSTNDFGAVPRDQLIHHRNEQIAARAKKQFDVMANTARSAVVDDFKSQISNLKFEISKEEQAAAGKLVFEKRCATCHRLQDIGKEVGADLAALKDRSTDALLTAILDPNKAVESKFLVYTVVTKDGLQHSGMLKSETGGSLTLIGNDGKEITVVRADIEELGGSQRSLMPEGLEKDLSATDLANVIAFVQSTGTPWKRFEGNSPKFVAANADGSVTLPASAAEIYGPSLIFEEKYGNLGYWTSADDYARWSFEVPKSGHWTVEFDFACDDSNAGSLIKFSTGNRMLTARVPGSGTWDNYQTWQAGTIDLHRGRGQLIITAPEKPPFALIDLRAVRLLPPK